MAAPARPSPTTLIGRDRELALLREGRGAAVAGRGSLILIDGEAGIGKTALADALSSEAAARGALTLVGRCYDRIDTPPYGPWREMFRDPPVAADAPLPTILARDATPATATYPNTLLDECQDFLAALAASRPEGTRPLVLTLDDLHWADHASLALLRPLARRCRIVPLLIVATYRTEELADGSPLASVLPALVREANPIRVHLGPLSDDGVRTLVRQQHDLAPPDLRRLLTYLQERAAGNPFFLRELLRALEEEGVLVETGAGWRLGNLERVRLPALVRLVIAARLDRLDAEARRALGLAAVIGQETPFALWQQIAQLDGERFARIVEQATEARIAEEWPGGRGMRFAHALIREVLYEAFPPPRRREAHRRVAESLLALPVAETDAIAQHLRRAGDPRAVAWLIRAGEEAQRVYAWLPAAARYAAALEQMAADGAEPVGRAWLLFRLARMQRHAAPAAAQSLLDEALPLAAGRDEALAAYLTFDRGVIAFFNGDAARGVAQMQRGMAALDALSTAARVSLAGRTYDDVSPDGHDRRGGLAIILANVGRYAEARPHAARVVAEAPPDREAGRAMTDAQADSIVDACRALAFCHLAQGGPAAARPWFARAREVARSQRLYAAFLATALEEVTWLAKRYDADRPGVQEALCAEGEAAAAAGRGAYDDLPPRRVFLPVLLRAGAWDEAMAIAATMGQYNEYIYHASAALVARARGGDDTALAERMVRTVLPGGPATAPGAVSFLPGLVLQRAAAALALDAGNLPAARAWLEAHDRWLAWNGAALERAEGRLAWVEWHRACGDDAAALAHARQALADAAEPRQALALLAAHRLIGELETAARRFEVAREHLDGADSLATVCAAPYERALILLARSELCIMTRQWTGARAHLDTAHTILASLGAQPALARAAVLRTAIERQQVSARAAHHLTWREHEVLHMIARGRSNRDIAAALALSVRTVDRHVENLYRKIDVHNKADATAYAFAHGLV